MKMITKEEIIEEIKKNYDVVKYVVEHEIKVYLDDAGELAKKIIAIHTEQFHGVDIQQLLNCWWPIFVLEFETVQDVYRYITDVTNERKITQRLWDGKKTKTGVDIIRRNGEIISAGVVLVFATTNEDYIWLVNHSKTEDTMYLYMVKNE
jgi:hypothetical protein